MQIPVNTKGKQELKINMLDLGVLLDYFILNTSDKNRLPYKLMIGTKLNSQGLKQNRLAIKTYPIRIFADDKEVYQDNKEQSLEYCDR